MSRIEQEEDADVAEMVDPAVVACLRDRVVGGNVM